ncbi:MAG: hypothetical protein OCD02_09175 [Spirochaetaceae bacterium]
MVSKDSSFKRSGIIESKHETDKLLAVHDRSTKKWNIMPFTNY